MKPIYYVVIAVVLIIIIGVVISNRNKRATADANIAATQNQIINGDSSQVASIINSLFPYFQTGVNAATTPKPNQV